MDILEARRVVDRLQEAVCGLTKGLASRCRSSDGKNLDLEKQDALQVPLFTLTSVASEIAAADAALKTLEKKNLSAALDFFSADLIHFFIAEASHHFFDVAYRHSDVWQIDGKISEDFQNRYNDFVTAGLKTVFAESIADKILERYASGCESELSEAQTLFRDTFRKFTETEVKPLSEKIHRQDLLIPEDFIQKLAALGCFGLSLPQKFGGFQDDDKPDHTGMIVVTEELSRGSLGVAGSLITRPEIMAKAILKGGTEAQKQKWLPLLATGERMAAVAVTEPDFGSDVAAMTVSATPVAGGFEINGCKTWCTFAGYADLLLVLARTNPDMSLKHRGLSLFLVEKPRFSDHDFEVRQPNGGKLSGRAIATIGYRGMHSFECFFDRYFVPEENLIGGKDGLGKGFYLQMEGFSGGRLQTAGRALGVMQAAFEAAVQYAKDRKVFGKPLAAYSLTKYKITKMAALIHVIREFTYTVARLMDEGKGVMEASQVKLYASRTAEWVTREALQIHGGMGYAEEFPVSRYFVDARVFSIFEGAEETLALRVVGKQMLDGIMTFD